MNLPQHLAIELEAIEASRWVVAYSGGADSSALLHALKCISDTPILALHINHGITTSADETEAFCRAQAQLLGVDIEVHRCGLGAEASETAAREARYGVFEEVLEADDVLLLGHHGDDQVETFLIRMMRGEGLLGLSGMPKGRQLAAGRLFRPFLTIGRADVLDYCAAHEVAFIEDPMNQDVKVLRNRVRHSLLPSIEQVSPNSAQAILRTVAQLNVAQATLNQALTSLGRGRSGDSRWGAWLSPIEELTDQSAWIHHWITTQLKLSVRGSVVEQLAHSFGFDNEQRFSLNFGGGSFHVYDGRLWFIRDYPVPNPLRLDQGGFEWYGTLYGVRRSSHGMRFRNGDYTIEPLVLNQKIRIAGRYGTRKLKKVFQELGVPWWARERLPAVYDGEKIVAVADLFIAEEYACSEGEDGVVLTPPSVE